MSKGNVQIKILSDPELFLDAIYSDVDWKKTREMISGPEHFFMIGHGSIGFMRGLEADSKGESDWPHYFLKVVHGPWRSETPLKRLDRDFEGGCFTTTCTGNDFTGYLGRYMQDYTRMKGEGDFLILAQNEDLAERAALHLPTLGYEVL